MESLPSLSADDKVQLTLLRGVLVEFNYSMLTALGFLELIVSQFYAPWGYFASKQFAKDVDQLSQKARARAVTSFGAVSSARGRLSSGLGETLGALLRQFADLLVSVDGVGLPALLWRIEKFLVDEAQALQGLHFGAVLYQFWDVVEDPLTASRKRFVQMKADARTDRERRLRAVQSLRGQVAAISTHVIQLMNTALGDDVPIVLQATEDVIQRDPLFMDFFVCNTRANPGVQHMISARQDLKNMLSWYKQLPTVRTSLSYRHTARQSWAILKRTAFPLYVPQEVDEFVRMVHARIRWFKANKPSGIHWKPKVTELEGVLTAYKTGSISASVLPGPRDRGDLYSWLFVDREDAFDDVGGELATGVDDADEWVTFSGDYDTDLRIYEDVRVALQTRFSRAPDLLSNHMLFNVRTMNGLPPMGIEHGMLRPHPSKRALLSLGEDGAPAEVAAYKNGNFNMYEQSVPMLGSDTEDSDGDVRMVSHVPVSSVINLIEEPVRVRKNKRKRLPVVDDVQMRRVTSVVESVHSVDFDTYRGPYEPTSESGRVFNLKALVAGIGGKKALAARHHDIMGEGCRCAAPAQCASASVCECSATKTECPVGALTHHPRFIRGVPRGECSNQRIQRRQFPMLDPVEQGKKGVGVNSAGAIQRGEFVIEYIGEVIGKAEYKRRAKAIVETNGNSVYFFQRRDGAIIDAMFRGNIARFVNHSCNPNTEAQSWYVDGAEHVVLVAIRNIAAGDEIVFDYGFTIDGDYNDLPQTKCLCGSKPCCGFLGQPIPRESSSSDDSDATVDGSDSDTSDSSIGSIGRFESRQPSPKRAKVEASSSSSSSARVLPVLQVQDPSAVSDTRMQDVEPVDFIDDATDDDTDNEAAAPPPSAPPSHLVDISLVFDRVKIEKARGRRRRRHDVCVRDVIGCIVTRSRALHTSFRALMNIGEGILRYTTDVHDTHAALLWVQQTNHQLVEQRQDTVLRFQSLFAVIKQHVESRKVPAPSWAAVLEARKTALQHSRNTVAIVMRVLNVYDQSLRRPGSVNLSHELNELMTPLIVNIHKAVFNINFYGGYLERDYSTRIGYLPMPRMHSRARMVSSDIARRRTQSSRAPPHVYGGVDFSNIFDDDEDEDMVGGSVSKKYVSAYMRHTDSF